MVINNENSLKTILEFVANLVAVVSFSAYSFFLPHQGQMWPKGSQIADKKQSFIF